MAVIPAYASKGTAMSQAAAATITPPDDASQPSDRLLILAIHTANQPFPSLADGAGNAAAWALIPGADHNNGGAAGAAGSVRAWLYFKWGSGTGNPAHDRAVIGDSGDHQYGHIFAFDNVDQVDPFGVVATAAQAATTAAVMPGVTTDEDNSLVCYFTFLARDATSTANLSAQANANLTEVTERHDQSTTTALGGGICLTTGLLAAAGASGDLTATAVSQSMVHITVALNPGVDKAKAEQLGAEVWGAMQSDAVVEQLAAEVWFIVSNAGRVYGLSAEAWFQVYNAGRVYGLAAEVWFTEPAQDDGRRMSLM